MYQSICHQSTVSDSLSPSSSSSSFASSSSSPSDFVCNDSSTHVFCDTKRSLLAMPNFITIGPVKKFLTLEQDEILQATAKMMAEATGSDYMEHYRALVGLMSPAVAHPDASSASATSGGASGCDETLPSLASEMSI